MLLLVNEYFSLFIVSVVCRGLFFLIHFLLHYACVYVLKRGLLFDLCTPCTLAALTN
jgi:hypothetical protein